MVFIPIALGTFAGITQEQAEGIRFFAVRGRHKTMGGMAVNHIPMFAEFCVWLTDDFERAVKLAERMKASQDDLLEEGTSDDNAQG